MADSPVDMISEIMSDLTLAMEYGVDLDYHRTKDNRIAVRIYDDDGTLSDVVGHLTYEEKK